MEGGGLVWNNESASENARESDRERERERSNLMVKKRVAISHVYGKK